jgi:iron(III) transport system ATP-binding protein
VAIDSLGKALIVTNPRPDLFVGEKVTIIVRPEAVKVQPENGIFKGLVRRAVYLGNLIEYDMEVGGQLITGVETDPSKMEVIPVGSTVSIGFVENCIQVLPAEKVNG